MIRNHENISYNDWKADDTLRAGINAHGMDDYFNENYEPETTTNGVPEVGYKFFITVKKSDGSKVLLSPFAEDSILDTLGVPDHVLKSWDMLEDKERLQQYMDNGAKIKLDEINVDTTGRGGYYFYRNRDTAEDYLKAMLTHYEHKDRSYITTIQEEYYNKFTGKKQEEYGTLNFVYGRQKPTLDYSDKCYDQFGTKETGRETYTYERNVGLATKYKARVDIIPTNASSNIAWEMFRVYGTGVENTFGDAGILMNEMKIDPEPVLSIPLSDPYDATHRRN